MTNKERLEDLLIEFDELGMIPTLTVPNPEERAKDWKHELTYAIRHLKAEVAMEICCKIEEEIVAALESNYNARAERLRNPRCESADEFIAHSEGKIAALRGIEGFVEELKDRYTEGRNN